jgi:GntR family transcriptional repressor for pyruvate dehydrogenase complex
MSMPYIAAQTLQGQILGGTYAPGAMLPGQRDLAEALGISRASLREALSMLEALGFIRSIPGKGTFVARQGGSESAAASALEPALGPPDATLQFRFVIEPAAAALAARGFDGRCAPRLWGLQARFEEAVHTLDLVAAARADLEFHQLVAELSGNEHIRQVAHDFEERIGHSQRLPFANHARAGEPAVEHRAITAAICAGNAEAARLAMQTHLLNSAERTGLLFLQP